MVTGLLLAVGYLATSVFTGLDQAGVISPAPGGLLQRVTIIVGFSWIVLLALSRRIWRAQVNSVQDAVAASS